MAELAGEQLRDMALSLIRISFAVDSGKIKIENATMETDQEMVRDRPTEIAANDGWERRTPSENWTLDIHAKFQDCKREK